MSLLTHYGPVLALIFGAAVVFAFAEIPNLSGTGPLWFSASASVVLSVIVVTWGQTFAADASDYRTLIGGLAILGFAAGAAVGVISNRHLVNKAFSKKSPR